jgi:ATP-dependent DNA helicase RecQ
MIRKIRQALAKYWGYENFLPLQQEAMQCLGAGRDSIVVLPTGGGKSLCYQAPAMAMEGLAVVVSPLISLMKDQVDALAECGIPAMRFDSSLTAAEQSRVRAGIQEKSLKLLYLSPERLLSDWFIELFRNAPVSYIAVDEAHCVSMWGHDFRPEYRQLGRLREVFPDVTVAAYTATATAQVRADIAQQLRLKSPQVLVGSFDRPNLIYKMSPRADRLKQICGVLDRHKGESGIIYCIRRRDVDEMCGDLQERGYRVAPYHAGMKDQQRKENQDRFIGDKVDTIVATIAFGMGIDKSNVRYVIHAAMPKSLEHYQQESGRAGRDGLEAECCLFYSGEDYSIWKYLTKDMPEEAKKVALAKLSEMYRFCTGGLCRHQAVLQYFGQSLNKDNCRACDVCLGELEEVADSLVTAQKILSCVLRLEQRYGGAYTASVLMGSAEKRILDNGHDKLSTYGLLSDFTQPVVQDWIDQLAGQGYVEKTGEYNVLQVTEKGRAMLKGNGTPRLLKPSRKPVKTADVAADSWEGVDRGLFDRLRQVRSAIASEKGLPAYIVFGDATLRDLARLRPVSLDRLLQARGVGQRKSQQYGRVFLDAIRGYCQANSLRTNIDPASAVGYADSPTKAQNPRLKRSAARRQAFQLFKKGQPLEQVARSVERAITTTFQYLVEFIEREKVADPAPWIDQQTFRIVAEEAGRLGNERVKPIFDALQGRIDHDRIRICLACLRNRRSQ